MRQITLAEGGFPDFLGIPLQSPKKSASMAQTHHTGRRPRSVGWDKQAALFIDRPRQPLRHSAVRYGYVATRGERESLAGCRLTALAGAPSSPSGLARAAGWQFRI